MPRLIVADRADSASHPITLIRRIRVRHVILARKRKIVYSWPKSAIFPELVHKENCRRISLANNFIEDLPDLRCSKLPVSP